jgi:hypothetical protein
VVTQFPELFENRVGLGASWILEGAGFGCSDEGRFGGQALVVGLRQTLGHYKRDGVRHSLALAHGLEGDGEPGGVH